MQTSNFARSSRDPNAVGIALRPPPWWKGRNYRALAPDGDTLKLPWPEYVARYRQKLARLSPQQVLADLGPDAILCCFERERERCHRSLVAEWLEAELGIEVPEVPHGIPPRREEPAAFDL